MEGRVEEVVCMAKYPELANCHIYDLADAKALYVILNKSGWAS